MLTSLADNLWEANQPLRVFGFDLGHRMVVIRLETGELVVISPIALSTAVIGDLKQLGPVNYLVSPSSMHDLFLYDWMNAFPKATLLHSPALNLRRLDSSRARPITRGLFPELEALPVGGMPKIQESTFLHRPSRSLIICDLVFNLPPGRGIQKLLQKMNGIYERLGPSKFFLTWIRNPEEFKQSLAVILAQDFDKLLLSHGHNVHQNGRDILNFAFLNTALQP